MWRDIVKRNIELRPDGPGVEKLIKSQPSKPATKTVDVRPISDVPPPGFPKITTADAGFQTFTGGPAPVSPAQQSAVASQSTGKTINNQNTINLIGESFETLIAKLQAAARQLNINGA